MRWLGSGLLTAVPEGVFNRLLGRSVIRSCVRLGGGCGCGCRWVGLAVAVAIAIAIAVAVAVAVAQQALLEVGVAVVTGVVAAVVKAEAAR